MHTPTGVTLWFAQFKIATNFQIKKKNYGYGLALTLMSIFLKLIMGASTS